jgi:hypothetical protein
MEAANAFEMLVPINLTTVHQITEDCNLKISTVEEQSFSDMPYYYEQQKFSHEVLSFWIKFRGNNNVIRNKLVERPTRHLRARVMSIYKVPLANITAGTYFVPK